jgi:hypothetical protein
VNKFHKKAQNLRKKDFAFFLKKVLALPWEIWYSVKAVA